MHEQEIEVELLNDNESETATDGVSLAGHQP